MYWEANSRKVYRFLTEKDVKTSLKHSTVYILWPGDGKWYLAEVEEVRLGSMRLSQQMLALPALGSSSVYLQSQVFVSWSADIWRCTSVTYRLHDRYYRVYVVCRSWMFVSAVPICVTLRPMKRSRWTCRSSYRKNALQLVSSNCQQQQGMQDTLRHYCCDACKCVRAGAAWPPLFCCKQCSCRCHGLDSQSESHTTKALPSYSSSS